MSYKVTAFASERTVKNGVVMSFDKFEDLADQFKTCNKGDKLGSGFVRCELDPPERHDDNVTKSKLLIIDGDEGIRGRNAPRPIFVHEALLQLKLNHFIFTSHSHSTKRNKFRCIIESTEYEKGSLCINNDAILDKLDSLGIRIKHVSEMDAMSQIWFDARRDDPEDGLYEYYKYIDGNKWEAKHEQESEAEVKTQSETSSAESGQGSETLPELYNNIRTGKEYHESLRNISWQLVKDGMSAAHVKAHITTLMEGSKDAGSDRWNSRIGELDRLVAGAVSRLEGTGDLFELESGQQSVVEANDMPKPPGPLGDLYDAAYSFLMLQYPEVAMAATISLVAGVAGRKFNTAQPKPGGLNMFITIIAETGVGKDSINDFISMCLRDGIQSYESFIGRSHFYSPKAMVNSFKDARSQVCVISEAGLMMKVKAGNVDGLAAFILDAFQCSHQGGYTKSHGYSSAENDMESIRAMAMTVVSESSPAKMIEAYADTGALESGLLPRQLLFRIAKRRHDINQCATSNLPLVLRERLEALLTECAGVQAEADPKAHMLKFDKGLFEDYLAYYHKYSSLSEENTGTDPIRKNMATRIAQKALKLAGIATVFNKSADEANCLIIEKAEWEWAKAICDYEFENISEALHGMTGDQSMDNATLAVYQKMSNICDDSIRDKKCKMNAKYRGKKIIHMSKLKIACKATPAIMNINDKHGRMIMGVDKVLGNMKESGAITIPPVDPLGGRGQVIVIKEKMNDYIKPFLP